MKIGQYPYISYVKGLQEVTALNAYHCQVMNAYGTVLQKFNPCVAGSRGEHLLC